MNNLCQKLEIGQRWAYWLHQAYPKDAAKLIARDFDVSISTSTRWLGGVVPTFDHFTLAAKRWGRPFLAFVFERLPKMSDDQVDDRLLEAEQAAARAFHLMQEIKNEKLGFGSGNRGGFSSGSGIGEASSLGALTALKRAS